MGSIIWTNLSQSQIVYDEFLDTDDQGDTYRHKLVGTHSDFSFQVNGCLGINVGDNISMNVENYYFNIFTITSIENTYDIFTYYSVADDTIDGWISKKEPFIFN